MTDRPILFSGPMVRALWTGRKTQTRRVLKGVPPEPAANCHPSNVARHERPYFDAYCGQPATAFNPRGMSDRWCWWQVDDRQNGETVRVGYVPGDALWVRETWAVGTIYDGMPPRDINPEGKPNWCGIRYAATDSRNGIRDRTSIHMPRWASRLYLIVTDVRVQRLCAISAEDAIAEGIVEDDGSEPGIFYLPGASMICGVNAPKGRLPIDSHGRPEAVYRDLVNNLHGGDLWRENPWVVALTFVVVKSNIDVPLEREDAA